MRAQLAEAFEEESRANALDPAEVLLGTRASIERRRRRRRHYRTGGVLAAVLLALTASTVALTALRDGGDAPAIVGTADPIPVGEWKSTLRFGWLPAGLAPPLLTSTVYAQDVLYPGTTTSPQRDYLRVSVYPADETPDLDLPGWQRVDVNGRPAAERSERTRTFVNFQLPSGRWVIVEFGKGIPDSGPDGQPRHRDTALRIARSTDQTGDTELRTGFAPSYLPNGQRIVGVSTEVGAPPGFGGIHCDGPAGPPAPSTPPAGAFTGGVDGQHGPGVSIRVDPVAPAGLDRAERIADIQGRPAYRLGDGAMIAVTDFHGGTLTVTATIGQPGTGKAPPALDPGAELIKIAEGVRWLR